MHLVGQLTDGGVSVCADGQDPGACLRHHVRAASRRVVQAGPARPAASPRSAGALSGVFLVSAFPRRLSAKGPAKVGLEAQVDQRVVKSGGFGERRRGRERCRRNRVRVHEGRPHGYGGVRTPR